MTPAEIRDWIEMLGSTRQVQIAVLKDLLRHATGDEMSSEDRTICTIALRILGRDVTAMPAEELRPTDDWRRDAEAPKVISHRVQ